MKQASTLLRKMSLALPQAVIHHRALLAFTESLQVEHAEYITEWEAQVQKWKLNHALPCPYDLPGQSKSSYHWVDLLCFILKTHSKIGVTFAEVKHQLSQEEYEQVEKGETIMGMDDGSPSAFVVEGLELEETQCVAL